MKLERRTLFSGTGVAIVALIAFWFFANHERVAEEIEVGYHGEARVNPLLAAQRLLAGLRFDVRSMDGLEGLPPAGGTLVLATRREAIGPSRAQRILEWVEKGGHLVAVAWTRKGKADPLLDGLEVRRIENPQAPQRHDVPAVADFPEEFLEVAFSPRYRLEFPADEALFTVSDEHGLHAASLAYGSGFVTVLSDPGFLFNRYIGKFDHGAFLLRLAGMTGGGEVWLVHGEEMPNLFVLLWQHGFPVLLAGAVLLAAWLWGAGSRFGPLLPAPPLARRRLLEHIEASGRFFWQQGQGGQLLAEVRESFLRTVEFRHPGWSRSPDLVERLAKAGGLPVETVKSALKDPAYRDEQGFTRMIQTLEAIRKRL